MERGCGGCRGRLGGEGAKQGQSRGRGARHVKGVRRSVEEVRQILCHI